MKTALMLACFFAFGLNTHAAEMLSSEEFAAQEAQRRCGDDLRCYFSPEELEAALGPDASTSEASFQAQPHFHAEEDGGLSDEALEMFDASTKAPIWASFIANFRKCAPGCVPANYSTYGRRAKPSCHDTGRAADVGAITCAGRTYKAINRGKYETFVGCMKKHMIVLYRNGKGVTTGHHDHAHFSNGCTLKGGKKYWGDEGVDTE